MSGKNKKPRATPGPLYLLADPSLASQRRRPQWHQAGPRLRRATSSSRPPPRYRFPESRAEDSLGSTKVPPSKPSVNLSPGRQTVLLVANVCTLNVELDCLCCRLGPRSHLEFAVNVAQMGFDSAFAQAEAIGDRLVAHAHDHHPEELGLPLRSRFGQGPASSSE